jgi:hypothetical protein
MDTLLGLIVAAAFLAFLAGLFYLVLVVVPGIQERQASGYLNAWASAEGLSLVSRHRIRMGTAGVWPPGLVEYRVVVEDREGRRRRGRVATLGRWSGVKVRWEEPEGAVPAPDPRADPLWDMMVDGS